MRYDVRLSKEFILSTQKVVAHLVGRHADAEEFPDQDDHSNWIEYRDEFKWFYGDISLNAVNQAKLRGEIQIDFLAQSAMVKMFLQQIRCQFNKMIDGYICAIRKNELSSSKNLSKILHLKEKLSRIRQRRENIIKAAGVDLFQLLSEIQEGDLKELREINFGPDALIHRDVFNNPMLHVPDVYDEWFTLEEYQLLLGKKFDDPDNYDQLIKLIKSILEELSISGDNYLAAAPGKEKQPDDIREIEDWIKQPCNIDILLNFFETQKQLKLIKKENSPPKNIFQLKKKINHQKLIFNFFLKKFSQKKLIKKIIAAIEIYPLYLQYCPPLSPHHITEFLLYSKKRRHTYRLLKQSKKIFNRPFYMKPLKKKMRQFEVISYKTRKIYFIRFLKNLIRYHRDMTNYKMLKEAINFINLTEDEKIINLSRTNHTLYEFLLPRESVLQKKPVINHVILKADLRGSTEITLQLKRKNLNPATYFSLNFFDPITSILNDYGASKVFIEGDAIILAITEHEKTPQGWYGVARACGLAIHILAILGRCNSQCRKNGLPTLEVGIGISFTDSPPTYLFDGEKKIMISPGINLADRLSSCSRILRNRFAMSNSPFNIYIYNFTKNKNRKLEDEGTYLRYNVNGIELSSQAFIKLKSEIELKYLEAILPEIEKKELRLYIGKYPTVSGKRRHLVIREEGIREMISEKPGTIKKTNKTYYEICTNPQLLGYVKKMMG